MATDVTSERLRQFVERIETLEEEKRALAEEIRGVYAEARGCGFDVPTMRAIVRLRRMDPSARAEQEALLETYKAALGLAG